MKRILLTGSSGQLGRCIIQRANFEMLTPTSSELDLSNEESIKSYLEREQPDYIINCAAYTNVDACENEEEYKLAYKINFLGVKALADYAKKSCRIIHVSTDYVYGGFNGVILENHEEWPKNSYGYTKLQGDRYLLMNTTNSMVIRTQWLWSEFGNNFVKKMIELFSNKKEISVIFDQVGSPTYAGHLAKAIIDIIEKDNFKAGLYHYTNEGTCSWYDFARAIARNYGFDTIIHPVTTLQYGSKTVRPFMNILDKSKFKETFGARIKHWYEALEAINKEKFEI